MNFTYTQQIDFYQKNYALICFIVTGVLFALSVAFFVYDTQKKNSSDKTFNKYNILGVGIILFLYALIIFLNQNMAAVIPVLLALTITATLLIFIYYLYQRDFFWLAALVALGCFLIYFTKSALLSGYLAILIRIMLIALAGVLVWLTLGIKKSKGYMGKKKNIKVVGEGAKYFPVWILCGLFVCAGIIPFITINFVFYAIVAVIAYFLAVGIYYTIKLI